MSNNPSSSSFYPTLRRAWAERFAAEHGSIVRRDIMGAFGVSTAQASADLQGLLQERPGCLAYDASRRRYIWTGGDPSLDLPSPVLALDVWSA